MQRPALKRSRLLEIQRRIGARVLETLRGSPGEPRLVAGLDAAYSRRYGAVAVAALLDARDLRLLRYSVALGEAPIPYIPGLLAFREAPALYTALRGLPAKPDLVMVDGHGAAHPRYAGIASHISLALGVPGIGVAKKRLYGVEEPIPGAGHAEPPMVEARLRDPASGMTLGYVIRATPRRRLYVDPGAFISPEAAASIVLEILRRQPGGRTLPAPTREADKLSKRIARLLDEGRLAPGDLRQEGLDRFLRLRG